MLPVFRLDRVLGSDIIPTAPCENVSSGISGQSDQSLRDLLTSVPAKTYTSVHGSKRNLA